MCIMWIIIYIFSIVILSLLIIGFYQKSTNAICKSKKRLDGKTAIVTGGTAGMGLETAKDFANRGARIIIACPFEKEGEKAQETIINETGNEKVIFKLLDLSSIESVRQFANEVLETEERLDILVNNAGVGSVNEYITSDGMSYIMQVNYFGQFLLTLLLLGLMKKTGKTGEPARIVNVLSLAQYLGKIDLERMNDIKYWYSTQLYGNSKLCLILFSRELTKRLKGTNIVINNADPGAVGTMIYECNGKLIGNILAFMGRTFSKTPWEGAQTAIHVALDNNAAKVSGEMFWNCRLSRATSAAYDDELAREVWDESVRLVRLNNKELETVNINDTYNE